MWVHKCSATVQPHHFDLSAKDTTRLFPIMFSDVQACTKHGQRDKKTDRQQDRWVSECSGVNQKEKADTFLKHSCHKTLLSATFLDKDRHIDKVREWIVQNKQKADKKKENQNKWPENIKHGWIKMFNQTLVDIYWEKDYWSRSILMLPAAVAKT